ncbi:reverse transcriptase domain-containing protein [Tanacetum coccineum]
MCVDFTNINKACPKDCYPLPEIDWKIESLSGFRLKCFLDAYKGYHQIQMAEEDKDKTSFYAGEGVFCYKKMPFGLKNTGATYQRLVDKVFSHQIGRNLEAYLDDMVIKSTSEEEMLKDIQETFERFQSIKMKLNPNKCSFGVEEGPFLGHLITKHGIKTNPSKVKAVSDLDQPRTLKDMKSLNGKLAALSRFLSNGAERSLAFFKVLKGCKDKKSIQPEKIGRVAKWAIEFGEHDIVFVRREEKETPANFLVEIPSEDNEKKEKPNEVPNSSIEHVRMNQSKKADALSKLASMTFEHLTKEVLVEVLMKRRYKRSQEDQNPGTTIQANLRKPVQKVLLHAMAPFRVPRIISSKEEKHFKEGMFADLLTLPRNSKKETPFSLTYGSKAVIPIIETTDDRGRVRKATKGKESKEEASI